MLRQHKGSMAHLDRQLQADANQMPELDVEAFSNPLEVVVLFQPGPVGIQSDGAVVRCVSTAVASFLRFRFRLLMLSAGLIGFVVDTFVVEMFEMEIVGKKGC